MRLYSPYEGRIEITHTRRECGARHCRTRARIVLARAAKLYSAAPGLAKLGADHRDLFIRRSQALPARHVGLASIFCPLAYSGNICNASGAKSNVRNGAAIPSLRFATAIGAPRCSVQGVHEHLQVEYGPADKINTGHDAW